MASARVDENIIRVEGLLPLRLRVLEQQETVVVAIQCQPVDLREGGLVRRIPPAGGHYPKVAALLADRAGRVDIVTDVRSTLRARVLRHVLDHAWMRLRRPQSVEGFQSRRLQVKVHEQN